MATVYAALVSLMNNMEQIRNHRRLSTCFDDINAQMETLGEYLELFLEFVESYSYLGEEVRDLEMRIASAAHAAEDVIETHVVNQIQSEFAEESWSLSVDLEKIIQEMSLIKEVVAKFKEGKMAHYVQQPTICTATTVERHDHLNEILDRLIGGSPDLEIISIVGSISIGKTTLARDAYENPIVTNHFYYRAWAAEFMFFKLEYILRRLLSCLGRSTRKLEKLNEDELGKELKRMLSGKRYLIILESIHRKEDIKEEWDRLKYFLPENKDGSRVIMTCRPRDLFAEVSTYILEVRPLGDLESWEVLCQMVFGHQNCPPQLEAIGREIAKYCRGYPLFISMIGGSLRKSSRKTEFWEHAAKNLSPINNLDKFNDQLKIMMKFTSDALPSFLKPCLVYLDTFFIGCDIHVSQFVKFWVAEGFLKPNKGLTLEEVAENCISELIDRNLIFVTSRRSNGKPRFCKIKPPLKYYCGEINDKKTLFSVLLDKEGSEEAIPNARRFLLFHDSTINGVGDYHKKFHAMESALLARSMICPDIACVSFKSRLLRVLHQVYCDSLEATFEQVNLRLLDYESIHGPIYWMPRYELPSSISLLWSVQTLIFGKKIELVVAPSQIWEMRQLRHLHFYRILLQIPPPSDEDDDASILQNLQTLKTAVNLKCSEEFCKRMPNVKKFRVFYDDRLGEEGQRKYWYSLFTKLESLHCSFHKFPNRDDLLRNLKLPSSLKKLVLQDCELHWSDLSIIGLLPLLEVLKLKCQSVRGPRWETVDGEFVRLKFLEIDSCYLIYWSAEASHFPFLEKLVLQRLYRLKEIPSEIGEIPTLEEISVVECSISVAMSAARIKEKQKQRGQRETKFRVGLRKEEEVEEFKVRMESDGIRSNGLQIYGF